MYLRKKHFHWLFLFVLVFICLTYNYIYISDFGPSSVHAWRQSDSASFALCYYHHGLSFFETKVHAFISGTSPEAVSEFPIIYYIAAIFYTLFGPNDVFLRLLDLFLYFLGVYCLGRLLMDFFNQKLWPVFGVLLVVLGSPLLAFYGFNFIPDTPALGLVLMGFYYYYFWRKQGGNYRFSMSILGFMLAGMIKPTILVLFFSIVFTELYIYMLKEHNLKLKKISIFTLSVLLPVLGWILWAKHYNSLFKGSIFSTTIAPFWIVKSEDMYLTFNHLISGHLYRMLPEITLYLFYGTIIYNSYHLLKNRTWLSFFYFLNFAGTIAYALLWFKRFKVHDYYLIEFFPFIILSFSLCLYLIQQSKKTKVFTYFSILLLVVGSWGVYKSGNYIFDQYFHLKYNSNSYPKSFHHRKKFKAFLKENDWVFDKNRAIIYPDDSPNIGLYNVDMHGMSFNHKFDKFHYFPGLAKNRGMEILFIIDKKVLNNPQLIPYLGTPLDTFENEIFVFNVCAIEYK